MHWKEEYNRIDRELINLIHLLGRPISKKIGRIADKKIPELELLINELLANPEIHLDHANIKVLEQKLKHAKIIKAKHILTCTWPS